MKKFYLHNGTAQEGPFDIEDLKARIINKDTPIWYEGISDWTAAGKIEELKDIFKNGSPPPFVTKQAPPPIKGIHMETKITPPPKKRNTAGIILQSIGGIAAIVIIAIIVISKINNSSNSSSSQTYQEKVLTVEEIEKANPTQFLDATGTYNQNFWGTALKVHGTVTNKATVAGYKDAVIEVTFYSKTETILDKKRFTIYEFFPAHTTKTFEWKLERPQACEKLGWDVVEATHN